MRSDRPISRLERGAWRLAATTMVAGAAFLALPSQSRAASADCSALMAAAKKQAKTPYHATYVLTPMTAGAFPTETHQQIWVDGKMYTLLPGPRWMFVRMADDPMGGIDGPIDGFSQCRPLPAVTIRGEATTGWAVKFESGRLAKIYISPKSALPVRDIAEQEPSIVTFDFDYANVHAPALK